MLELCTKARQMGHASTQAVIQAPGKVAPSTSGVDSLRGVPLIPFKVWQYMKGRYYVTFGPFPKGSAQARRFAKAIDPDELSLNVPEYDHTKIPIFAPDNIPCGFCGESVAAHSPATMRRHLVKTSTMLRKIGKLQKLCHEVATSPKEQQAS